MTSERFDILFAAQNVGGTFAEETGSLAVITQTVRGLRRAGHRVEFLALQGATVRCDPSLQGGIMPASLGLSGTRPFRVTEGAVRRVQQTLRLPYYALFDSFRFYEACLHHLPGKALCHEFVGLLSPGAALACKKLGIPYILSADADILFELEVTGQPLHGLRRHLATWAIRLSYQSAARIICASEVTKLQITRHWGVDPAKIVVIPNGVDVGLFGQSLDPIATRAGLELTRQPIVMFVGAFQPWHGVEGLVESFSQVVAKIPEARLVLVGDGRARRSIEARIGALALQQSVILTGMVSKQEVSVYLDIADVVVLPYPKLPQPMWFSPLKLYEAMAAGKAIVASRDGQIADVLQHGYNGLLVEPGDCTALAEAVLWLLNHPDERQAFGKRVRQQAVERHSWVHYIEQVEEAYNAVLTAYASDRKSG